ncbi:VOC family protein [Pseudorhodoplanes sp.]|uniref:VOC family protein n=1 Tax=Pseudorhodoplanes sp. TaxID=1934341 RepID=UPI003D12250E
MTTLGLSLDHVGLGIRNLDHARASFEKMGFRLTSRSMHAGALEPGGPVVPWGSGNHCAMFKHGYFELVGLVDDSMPSNVKRMVTRYEGLHIVAMNCSSSAAAYEALVEAGVKTAAPAKLERDAAFGINDEMVRRAKFENIHLNEEVNPEARFIVIEHRTPEILWQPHLLQHENGANELSSIYFASPNVALTVERLSRFLGAADRIDGAAVFKLARGRFWVMSEADMRAHSPVHRDGPVNRVAAAGIGVASLDRLRALFESRDIDYFEQPSLDASRSIWVGPSEASHGALVFTQTA